MRGNGWGLEGPPEDAYERVSDPEYFRGLHAAGRRLLDELEDRYDARRDRFTDDGPVPGEVLVPAGEGRASFGLAFTEFPGVVLWWAGRRRFALPYCACDARDETLAEDVATLPGRARWVLAGGAI